MIKQVIKLSFLLLCGQSFMMSRMNAAVIEIKGKSKISKPTKELMKTLDSIPLSIKITRDGLCCKQSKEKVEKLTLSNVSEKTYNANPELRAAVAAKEAADEVLAQSFSGYYPNLYASASYGVNKQTNPGKEKLTGITHSLAVEMAWNLFGDGTRVKIKMANKEVLANRFKYYAKEQAVLMSTISSYVNLWGAAVEVIIYEKMCANFEECLKFSQAQLASGVAKIQDVKSFESSFAQAKFKLQSAKAKFVGCKAELLQQMLEEPYGEIVLPDIPDGLPNTLKEFEDEAEKYNAEYLQSKYFSESAYYKPEVARSTLFGSLDVNGQVNHSGKTNQKIYHIENDIHGPNPDNTQSRGYTLGVKYTIPIWKNGGANPQSSVRRASAEREAAEYNRAAARLNLIKDVRQLWSKRESAKEQIKQSEVAVTSAEVSVDGYKDQAKYGISSATDVVYNENQLLESRLHYVEARKNYIITSYQMLFLTSKLSIDYKKSHLGKRDICKNEDRVRYAPLKLK